MTLIAVYTTVGARDQAQAIARGLVERGLVACAQISEIDSFYRWKGKVENDREFRILLKTTQGNYAAVEAAIRELHAYELPAIFAVPVTESFEPYRDWVEEAVGHFR